MIGQLVGCTEAIRDKLPFGIMWSSTCIWRPAMRHAARISRFLGVTGRCWPRQFSTLLTE